MSPSATQLLEQQHTAGVYPKRDVVIVRGKEAVLWDEHGRAYVDCVGGQGVSILGHANEAVARAIAEQALILVSCPEIFYNDRRAEFEALLVSLLPPGMQRVYLCNSGAEAVEAAIKFARLSTGRPNIVAAVRGFHGRTMGALSATFEPKLTASRSSRWSLVSRTCRLITSRRLSVRWTSKQRLC